jgi:hypothetical protein
MAVAGLLFIECGMSGLQSCDMSWWRYPSVLDVPFWDKDLVIALCLFASFCDVHYMGVSNIGKDKGDFGLLPSRGFSAYKQVLESNGKNFFAFTRTFYVSWIGFG